MRIGTRMSRRRMLRQELPPGPTVPSALQLLGVWKRPSAARRTTHGERRATRDPGRSDVLSMLLQAREPAVLSRCCPMPSRA
ncbi:MAG: cytochrome P450 [Actinomycetota bacterium]|nr:cytochrome P450 [Actinomycetota bacterium]